jgi:hypothetical protein
MILGVFTLIFGYLTYKMYLEFGWKMYKKMGADPNVKRTCMEVGMVDISLLMVMLVGMFRSYQVFLTVLKIDMFFLLAFSVQYMVLVLHRQDAEWLLTILALPFTFVTILYAVYGVGFISLLVHSLVETFIPMILSTRSITGLSLLIYFLHSCVPKCPSINWLGNSLVEARIATGIGGIYAQRLVGICVLCIQSFSNLAIG